MTTATEQLKALRQLAKRQGKSLHKTRGGYALRNIGKQQKGACPDSDSPSLDVIAFFLKGGQIDAIKSACGVTLWSRDGSP